VAFYILLRAEIERGEVFVSLWGIVITGKGEGWRAGWLFLLQCSSDVGPFLRNYVSYLPCNKYIIDTRPSIWNCVPFEGSYNSLPVTSRQVSSSPPRKKTPNPKFYIDLQAPPHSSPVPSRGFFLMGLCMLHLHRPTPRPCLLAGSV